MAKPMADIETLSAVVIDHALRVHRASGLGLLVNFGSSALEEGLKLVVNDHKNFVSSRESD